MMTGGLRIETRPMLHRAALGIGGGEIKPPNARKRDRRGAHRAGLKRHIEIAVDQPFGAERRSGGAEGQHFGMGGRIAIPQRAITGDRNKRAAPHHHGPDRNLPGLRRRVGGVKSRGKGVEGRRGRYFRLHKLRFSFRQTLQS